MIIMNENFYYKINEPIDYSLIDYSLMMHAVFESLFPNKNSCDSSKRFFIETFGL